MGVVMLAGFCDEGGGVISDCDSTEDDGGPTSGDADGAATAREF
jgi:hypothetical protein